MKQKYKEPDLMKLCAEWARIIMLDSFHDALEAALAAARGE